MKMLKQLLLMLLKAARSAQPDPRLLLKAAALAAVTIALISVVLLPSATVPAAESWKLTAECLLLVAGGCFVRKE